ncbi:MAG TPA: carboxypeptidase regulatory-like domain-containing protein [Vicinamibacterales bacterium]|nr:carboxypeptidase regulatory-like domain-containing protein [Vicinamibacterales bacterium]
MKALIAMLALAAFAAGAAPAAAQARQTGTLRIVVKDPSGAVIPNATVVVKGADAATRDVLIRELTSDGQGVASAVDMAPGRYTVTASFPGFESHTLSDVRVRAGDNRRELTLPIEKVAESVAVGQDPRAAASDPKSERFGNVLSREQIEALPDDPDEMEQVLKQMAGPGATLRMDGFRGGKLPPKAQIRSIRFSTAMFAAENHSAGHTFIDISTQPGLGPLRGSMDFSFRDGSMNARNAFQPQKGPEQTQQYNLNLSGTLLKDRTSFSLSAGGASLYDSANIFAAVPGSAVAAPVRRPSDRLNFNLRVDHAVNKSHTLRGSFQQTGGEQRNLGVGNYDLADRAYARTTSESLLRISESGPWSRLWYAESRLQLRRAASDTVSAFEGPTTRVLDAFTSGGAQVAGGRESTDLELATDIDYARRGHSIRMGALVEGGRYRSDTRTNYLGTYTFTSLDEYAARRPATYTQRTGNPLVTYSQWQAGLYLQDDWRVRQNLTLSAGVRQEFQTHLDDRWNFGPRGGFTWSPFTSGKTTVRSGVGLFYDWLEAETFEQTLRVDGSRQQDLVVVNPSFPDPFTGSGGEQVLPPGKYLLAGGLVMPRRAMALFAVTQRLSNTVSINASYNHQKGRDRFRGVNTNAPLNGVRPDATLGNVTQVESTARLEQDSINVGMNFTVPARRTFVFANYAWTNLRNDADGPFSLPADSYDLAGEWGRGGGVPRHIASAVVNTSLMRNLRLGLSTSARSGTPYTITTGRDDNGDTVFNDRPAGTPRNSVTGAAVWDMAARLTYAFGFGERPASTGTPGGQMVVMRMGGGAGDLLGGLGGGGAENKRIRIELFVAASNVFNNVNPMGYSGVMTSPFFGRPTIAGPARKIDVGMKIGF